MSIFQFFVAFLGGGALSVLGFCLARHILKRHERYYPLASVLRQTVSVIYLAALFFIGRKLPLHLYSLLIGGALGLTIPALILTAKLLKTANDMKESHSERRDDNG